MRLRVFFLLTSYVVIWSEWQRIFQKIRWWVFFSAPLNPSFCELRHRVLVFRLVWIQFFFLTKNLAWYPGRRFRKLPDSFLWLVLNNFPRLLWFVKRSGINNCDSLPPLIYSLRRRRSSKKKNLITVMWDIRFYTQSNAVVDVCRIFCGKDRAFHIFFSSFFS